MADPKTLIYFDNTDNTPAPASGFNVLFVDGVIQPPKTLWLGFDETTGELCVTNYNRTEIITCFSASGDAESFVKVNLTAAQIKTLFSAPVLAIPAPGVGKIIRLTWGAIKYQRGSASFTSQQLTAQYSSASFTSQAGQAGGSIFTSPQSTFAQIQLSSPTATNLYENEPMMLSSSSDSLVGDGTAEVWLYFKIITL